MKKSESYMEKLSAFTEKNAQKVIIFFTIMSRPNSEGQEQSQLVDYSENSLKN